MLDELLGRAPLKERIETLESELERTRARFEAERERRREAVRDRQEADERVNRLRDRVADLEGQLERARAGERAIEPRGTEPLRGTRLEEVLSRLRSVRTGAEGALTAMIDGAVPEPVRATFDEHATLLSRAEPCLALTDDAGIVSIALTPPLPPEPFVTWDDQFHLEDRWFLPAGTFGFALVRSDLFAYGRYQGTDRVDYRGFRSDVAGQHSKGGFSQARFERRREAQIDDHLDRCRSVLEAEAPSRLIVVGERTVLGDFADIAAHTATVAATGPPDDALEAAFRSFFTTTLQCI